MVRLDDDAIEVLERSLERNPLAVDRDRQLTSLERAVERLNDALATGDDSRVQLASEELVQLVGQIADVNRTGLREPSLAELERRLAELEPLVRRGAGAAAAVELERAHDARARKHRDAWRRARLGLAASLLVTGVVALGAHWQLQPPERATAAETISASLTSFLLIGLALYVVRIAAQSYRAHRHLDVVNTQKADALRTFNEMIGMERHPEVQAAIATALAGFVFASEGSGFLSDSAEHVTLIERGVAALTPGATPRP